MSGATRYEVRSEPNQNAVRVKERHRLKSLSATWLEVREVRVVARPNKEVIHNSGQVEANMPKSEKQPDGKEYRGGDRSS